MRYGNKDRKKRTVLITYLSYTEIGCTIKDGSLWLLLVTKRTVPNGSYKYKQLKTVNKMVFQVKVVILQYLITKRNTQNEYSNTTGLVGLSDRHS